MIHSWSWYRETLTGAWRTWWIYMQTRRHNLVGREYYHLGRSIGWRALRFGEPYARQLLWTPVNITRYFEFDFAWRMLVLDGFTPRRCLDVSSPFLFSFQVSRHWPKVEVRMMNPDARDLRRTRLIRDCLHWPGLELVETGVDTLDEKPPEQYDAVWSLSVIEHIAGADGDDRDAVRRLWRVVRPGGRLILTVPTDRQAWDEYRATDVYGLQPKSSAAASHFFQRFYDEASIRERISRTIGQEPVRMEWFGEKTAGHFHAYIARWRREGERATIGDSLDIIRNYRSYSSFAEMPGAGVCGLLFIKP